MLNAAGYRGAFKSFVCVDSAIRFLNRTASESDTLIAADLLFFSFDTNKHNLIEVMNRFSAVAPHSDETLQ